jgi:hypothetical protein
VKVYFLCYLPLTPGSATCAGSDSGIYCGLCEVKATVDQLSAKRSRKALINNNTLFLLFKYFIPFEVVLSFMHLILLISLTNPQFTFVFSPLFYVFNTAYLKTTSAALTMKNLLINSLMN